MSELVEAASFSNSIEAELARTYLESYGVSSVVFNASNRYIYPASNLKLMVVDRDLPEARKLLEQYAKEGER